MSSANFLALHNTMIDRTANAKNTLIYNFRISLNTKSVGLYACYIVIALNFLKNSEPVGLQLL